MSVRIDIDDGLPKGFPRRSHRRHPFYDKARVLDFISENPTVEKSFSYTISII